MPSVVGWPVGSAISAVQAAGFVAQTTPGSIDCGPPYVQRQSPEGGTTALPGSTVRLTINRQPTSGPCP
ncbi:PASTA domain-containing protein [Nonomuraea sp. NPDC050404]|uniref:PASTA domain-containing protein n=1 Tax=Nonomuraea sp. NPDC050404 TaxID=3155783 RepID=UPI0033C21B21